ncbi:MAG: hypothetical protein L0Y72_04455 [Gemmataceae bacterium]|nr:hypothetical protein [Gemmataceae bacterium]MCI0738272.1 hypothetical protein [Gemmataceae bacterium]
MCGYAAIPEKVAQLQRAFGIPPDQVSREKRRLEIRQQLQTKRGIVYGILAGLIVLSGVIYRNLVGATTLVDWIWIALVTVLSTVLAAFLIDCLVFRRIENRRVSAEFDNTRVTSW